MEQLENLSFEEKEKIRITQDIIDCDNNLVKCIIAGDQEMYREIFQKKEDLQFELEQLKPDEL